MKKEYGLIGFPLTHSFSAKYFTEKFARDNIEAEYINFETDDLGNLMEIIAEHPMLQGFNVTIPYKQEIIGYMSELSAEAMAIGAVNTVKILNPGTKDFRLVGYNTDYFGFRRSLEPLLNRQDKVKALVLGTGGASKAVGKVLSDLKVEFVNVSRTPNENQLSYDSLPDIINEYFLIVNTTPVGTFPQVDDAPDIPYELLTPGHLCHDLIYNPALSAFLRRCQERGCAVKNGLEMLVTQAEESWAIWNR